MVIEGQKFHAPSMGLAFPASLLPFLFMHDTDIDRLILEALEGTATDAQLSELEAWLEASPRHDRIYQEIVTYWHEHGRIDQAQVGRIWSQVSAQLAAEPVAAPRRIWWRAYRWQIAAVILTLLTLRAGLFYQQTWRMVEVRTQAGETREWLLPDSSMVILNANSQLRYRKGTPRQVTLAGEAFFKVRKKPATGERFMVQTPDLEVEVLGTSFNVNSRSGETAVFLEEGQVKLAFRMQALPPVIMTPGEMVTYATGQDSFQRTRPVASLPTSWKDGAIILEMVPLREVLVRMEAVYAIRIELAQPAWAEREVTLAFPVEDLPIALRTLEEVLGQKIIPQGPNAYLIR